MSAERIAILRRPTELVALLSAREGPFSSPAQQESLQHSHDPYCELIAPLNRDAPSPLLSAWNRLASVTRLDASTLVDVLVVLLSTIPDFEAMSDSRLPPLEEPPREIKATAAHPRAFKGTKSKPPKPGQVTLDVRPHLCHPDRLNRLLLRLAPHFLEAQAQLHSMGWTLPTLIKDGRPIDVYLLSHHGSSQESLYSLPRSFVRSILPTLKEKSWSEVGRFLSLYWALDLEQNPNLLRCVSRLSARYPEHASEWLELLIELPRRRRPSFAELLCEMEVARNAITQQNKADLAEMEKLSTNQLYRRRCWLVLSYIRDSRPLAYLLYGYRLANEIAPDQVFGYADPMSAYDENVRDAFILYLEDEQRQQSSLQLWSFCAEWPRMSALLLHPDWQSSPPEARSAMVYLFHHLTYQEMSLESFEAIWRICIERLPAMVALFREISPHFYGKAKGEIYELFEVQRNPELFRQELDGLFQILRIPCQERFEYWGPPSVYCHLLKVGQDDWPRLCSILHRGEAIARMEKLALRENNSGLLVDGMEALCRFIPTRILDGLDVCPSALFHAAMSLGYLGETVQGEIVTAWCQHPLLESLDRLSTQELVQRIEAHRPSQIFNPTPRKLRLWAQGAYRLKETQRARAHQKLLDGVERMRWELIGHLTVARLAQGLPEAEISPQIEHALRLYGLSEDNRRSLRRFLKAYLAGETTYLQDHPLNRRWLEHHDSIKVERWTRGVVTKHEHPTLGEVTLSTEQDPLEVLKMGTHVGSCLGLGGYNADSAVSVALDINKQVIYARDSKGRVVARQLVALGEDERLICYWIYYAVESDWSDIFRKHDQELAQSLGLAIHRPDNEAESIPRMLLSRVWYDDGAWNLRSD